MVMEEILVPYREPFLQQLLEHLMIQQVAVFHRQTLYGGLEVTLRLSQ